MFDDQKRSATTVLYDTASPVWLWPVAKKVDSFFFTCSVVASSVLVEVRKGDKCRKAYAVKLKIGGTKHGNGLTFLKLKVQGEAEEEQGQA